MRQKSSHGVLLSVVASASALALLIPLAGAQAGPIASGVRMDIEWRHRVEARGNNDFDAAQDDGQTGYLTRFRLGMGARLSPGLTAYAQLQDVRRSGDLSQRVTNLTTLHQGYLDFPGGKEGTSLRVGRQEIAFGEKRLVSDSGWSNSARTFDAVRLTHRAGPYTLDLFSANVVTKGYQPRNNPPQGSFHGLYMTSGSGKKTVKDAYALLRWRDGNLWTYGGRVRTPAAPGRVDWMAELAWQTGRQQGRKHQAHAGVLSAGYTLTAPWTPRIGVEYAYSPGDSNPDDPVVKTFDPLYPTTHPYYGIMDYFAWRNLRNLRASLSVNPLPRLRVAVDYHDMRLASAEDGWYGSNALRMQDKSGRSGRHVGREIDLQVDYRLGPRTALSAGYGHFFAGSYITRQKAAATDSDWGYLQATYSY
ncbi:MAG TPA: alginate export family protein [Armatimonadota bacterium]|jgi:hypothetical protein|nr:alginate export family protein [Armatimonadota bacterium]HOJ20561.1 alginate export family protein [Armatimonadota bacterium]HOM81263.1 alginate export family protein [Armatimonadota bacterium]HPO72869.1 alginate export family protein [Armatimonadota bacterium]HPT96683.1 alginate export family protein [Armatimonadota bacterium]